jgi:hypothetical protein
MLQRDLTLPLDDHSSLMEDAPEWEMSGEQGTIDTCEVRIGFDGYNISVCRCCTLPRKHPNNAVEQV